MIDFKDVNYIIGKKGDIQTGFSKIMSFYDNIGHNMLLISHESNSSGLSSWVHTSHRSFTHTNSLKDVIKNNLFRVDYLVMDVYLSASFLDLKKLESLVREITKIPIIFIVYVDPKIDLDEDYKMSFINKYKGRKDITIHKIERIIEKSSIPSNLSFPYLGSSDSEYHIFNIFEKWNVSFKELKLGYARNKKLEDIFKEDEEDI